MRAGEICKIQKDLREQGQEKYLSGLVFEKKRYQKYSETWEHDHCEFCNAKFSEDPSLECFHEGFSAKENYYWGCENCFDFFKEKYNLIEKVLESCLPKKK